MLTLEKIQHFEWTVTSNRGISRAQFIMHAVSFNRMRVGFVKLFLAISRSFGTNKNKWRLSNAVCVLSAIFLQTTSPTLERIKTSFRQVIVENWYISVSFLWSKSGALVHTTIQILCVKLFGRNAGIFYCKCFRLYT